MHEFFLPECSICADIIQFKDCNKILFGLKYPIELPEVGEVKN